MSITVKCSRCKKHHKLEIFNTRVQGPIIQVYCPFCREETARNLGKFVEAQLFPLEKQLGRYDRCAIIVARGRKIEKEFN